MHAGFPATNGRSVLLALAVICVAGCGGASQKTSDQDMASRLEGFAPGDPVVLACRMKSVPETFPVGPSGRELSRSDDGILVQVPRSDADRIAGVPGVQGVSVWGTPSQVEKMDPWLQAQILNAWSRGAPVTLSCMVRFANGTPDLRKRLTDMGAEPHTVAGPVVTLDASDAVILKFLEMPELVSISQPRMLEPMDSKSGN